MMQRPLIRQKIKANFISNVAIPLKPSFIIDPIKQVGPVAVHRSTLNSKSSGLWKNKFRH